MPIYGSNQRVYYAIQAMGFAPLGTSVLAGYLTTGIQGYRSAKGVQSVSSNINFQLDPLLQLGQLESYEQVESIPAVECTAEKAVDGRSLLEHLASPSAVAAGLASRYNDARCQIAIAYYPITQEFASGTPLSITVMSGMYVSSINWNIPVEGITTESVTFVGNDKTWYNVPSGNIFTTGTQFSGYESPYATGVFPSTGTASRRQNVNMTLSRWPTEIPGISGDGRNPTLANGNLGAHIQNVSVSVSLGRQELFELGRRGPYFRYADFPTEVTTTIEFIGTEFGDNINAAQESSTNLSDQTIKIVMDQGVTLDLGNKNKLRNVGTNGGDTGGGNVTTSYEYVNLNRLTVLASGDPAGLTA